MSYYTALISAWNTGTVPSGVTGSALTGQTTAQKLININGWTITGVVPTSAFFKGSDVANCINYAEFKALTAAQQANLLALCANPGLLLGGSANAGLLTGGMFLDYFTNHSGPTILALTALAQAVVTPWWQMPSTASPTPGGGLNGPVSQADLTAAGGLT